MKVIPMGAGCVASISTKRVVCFLTGLVGTIKKQYVLSQILAQFHGLINLDFQKFYNLKIHSAENRCEIHLRLHHLNFILRHFMWNSSS